MPELKMPTLQQEQHEPIVPNVQNDEKEKKSQWLKEEILVEFYNLEEPGVPLRFSYGSSKKPENFTLLHGGKYTLRREIVNHLESRQIPLWGYKPDGSGKMVKDLKGYKSRFQCRQVFNQ